MVLIIFLAVVIVVSLAGYALHLHLKLKRFDAEHELAQLEFAQQLEKKMEVTKKSISVLAQALVAEELSVTEGCLRISWLLGQIDLQAREKEAYTVFYQVADATSYIPILDAWKALSREQRKAFDRERFEVEKAFQDFVLDASKKLLAEGTLKPVSVSSGLYYSA